MMIGSVIGIKPARTPSEILRISWISI